MYANNNRPQNEKNVSTKGIQFMNKEGVEPSTLIFGLWNDMMTFKIHPALPQDKQGSKVYDYDHSLQTALTVSSLCSLYGRIKNVLLPAMEKGEDKRVGVSTKSGSAISISTGVKETGTVSPILYVFKDIDAETRIPAQAISYTFNKDFVIEDYDHTTGKFTPVDGLFGEFETLVYNIETAIKHAAAQTSHSTRNEGFYRLKAEKNIIDQMASKMGVEVKSSNGGNSSYNKPANPFGSNASSNSPSYAGSTPVTGGTLDELEMD